MADRQSASSRAKGQRRSKDGKFAAGRATAATAPLDAHPMPYQLSRLIEAVHAFYGTLPQSIDHKRIMDLGKGADLSLPHVFSGELVRFLESVHNGEWGKNPDTPEKALQVARLGYESMLVEEPDSEHLMQELADKINEHERLAASGDKIES